jgi:hypothetical protein
MPALFPSSIKVTFMKTFENVSTPWGKSQGGQQLASGITNYHTASHGGIKVIKKLNNQIPMGLRRYDGWYEEDYDSCIVFYVFYDAIKAHMTATGMPGWTCSAQEYFSEFTRDWFKQQLERWNIPECIYHFGTVYEPQILADYRRHHGEDAITTRIRHIQCKERTPLPKFGDHVVFDAPLDFGAYGKHASFVYQGGNRFHTLEGMRCRIRQWQAMEYGMHPT